MTQTQTALSDQRWRKNGVLYTGQQVFRLLKNASNKTAGSMLMTRVGQYFQRYLRTR